MTFITDIHTVAVEAPKLRKALGSDEAEDKSLGAKIDALTEAINALTESNAAVVESNAALVVSNEATQAKDQELIDLLTKSPEPPIVGVQIVPDKPTSH